jgi:hypothetical protein
MAMKRCSGHWNSWPEPAPWKVLARWAPSIQVPLTVSPRFRLLRISHDFSQQNLGFHPNLGFHSPEIGFAPSKNLGFKQSSGCNQERMGELLPHSGLSKRFGCSVLEKRLRWKNFM